MIPTVSVDSAVLRALAADAPATLERLQIGDRVAGRVLDVLANSQYLLALGTSRIVAQSALPLTAGQALTLEVVSASGPTELRVVHEDTAGLTAAASADLAGQRLAVAALVTAVRQGTHDVVPAPTSKSALVQALLNALASSDGQLASADLDAAAHLLPMPVDGDAEALAAQLRASVENGGLNFESRLRALLEKNPGTANEEAVAHLRDDARTLLGRAATALADATSPQNAIARQQVDSATSQMLAQQARLGLDWAMDQTINVNLPVRLPSGDAEVNLSVARDRDPDADPDAPSTFRATFRVMSALLGPVETTVSWHGGSLSATMRLSRGSWSMV